ANHPCSCPSRRQPPTYTSFFGLQALDKNSLEKYYTIPSALPAFPNRAGLSQSAKQIHSSLAGQPSCYPRRTFDQQTPSSSTHPPLPLSIAMFSKSVVTTSLFLALLAPSTLVSAAPVGSSPTNTAELTTRARLPIRIVRDGLPIKIIGARDNLEQDRSLLSKREPQPGRNNISNPRGDILKGLLEKLGERKCDLTTIDLDARDYSSDEELVEREPFFGLVKGLFSGGSRSFDDEDTLDARNRLGIILPKLKSSM
ncbi:hypothetical protein BKA70DRAFT_1536732, partial [Coprinopsis sp. MPI-PUGE-AT-0042]